MAEAVQKSIIQEGIEIGILEGIEIGKSREIVNKILKLLQLRFNQVPNEITTELSSRADLVALDSLFVLAYQCNTLDEFAKALK